MLLQLSLAAMALAGVIGIIRFIASLLAGWWYDPLWRYEPVSDDEALLLTVVDEAHYSDLLEYVRTMDMSPDLQDYLKDDKEALESISYYMMLQVAKKDKEKKEQWEKEFLEGPRRAAMTHSERMILQRLKQYNDG